MRNTSIHAVKASHKKDLFSRRNVVSVGVGLKTIGGQETDEECIVVGVTKKLAKSQLAKRDVIPTSLEGCSTDVIEAGIVKALENVGRLRPASGGISIGHKDITAGTLGCLVTKNGETFILSNNHVLANSNAGQSGDAILQPGPHDGGSEGTDQIGTLVEFVPIEFDDGGGLPPLPPGPDLPPICEIAKTVAKVINSFAQITNATHRVKAYIPGEPRAVNMVDAAIAKPTSADLVTAEILEIGAPTGAATVALGDNLKKTGRTTEFTQGTVSQLDVTVQVQYGAGKVATFEDQIVSRIQSGGGDSGSAVLNDNNEVIGLLFAGSDTLTILNPIHHVLSALNVQILV